jgi:hypothetical protein
MKRCRTRSAPRRPVDPGRGLFPKLVALRHRNCRSVPSSGPARPRSPMRATLLARLLLLVGLALLPALGHAGPRRAELWPGTRAAGARGRAAARPPRRRRAGARHRGAHASSSPHWARRLRCWPGTSRPAASTSPDLLREFPRYANITATDREGRITCSVLADGPGRSLADRAYFRDAMRTGGFVVGEHIVGRASGRSSISFAQPYLGRDGLVAGCRVGGARPRLACGAARPGAAAARCLRDHPGPQRHLPGEAAGDSWPGRDPHARALVAVPAAAPCRDERRPGAGRGGPHRRLRAARRGGKRHVRDGGPRCGARLRGGGAGAARAVSA